MQRLDTGSTAIECIEPDSSELLTPQIGFWSDANGSKPSSDWGTTIQLGQRTGGQQSADNGSGEAEKSARADLRACALFGDSGAPAILGTDQ